MSESHKNSEILPVGTRVALKFDRINPTHGEVIGHTEDDKKMWVKWDDHKYIVPYLPMELRRV